mgnify:FL=1|jgi:hypothetical protein|tara:strand:+ start:690 stop:929 length:240 start_codon:yes stop_codon:yes gene_type:complete
MKTNFDKMRELNKSILEDAEIKMLLEQKTKLLNRLTPKYLVNVETNTATAILDEKEIEMLDKIDLLVKHRTAQIKRHYA